MTTYKSDSWSKSGPAITVTIAKYFYSQDYVRTFPYVCFKTIQQWFKRPRQFDWPPSELRTRILHMKGNIVATGRKGCQNEEIEWRLCFNEIEVLLVNSWNDTQMKLFKVLKMIKKDIIVQAGFNISSYIMKNIVFWLSESYPQSEFIPEKLFSWVIKSLRVLRKAVKGYSLPYYMIFKRNLIEERVPRCQQNDLLKEISELVHCGPQLLWECAKLEFAMSMTFNELLYFGNWCDRLEELTMKFAICFKHSQVANTNTTRIAIENEIQLFVFVMTSTKPRVVSEMLKKKNILPLLLG